MDWDGGSAVIADLVRGLDRNRRLPGPWVRRRRHVPAHSSPADIRLVCALARENLGTVEAAEIDLTSVAVAASHTPEVIRMVLPRGSTGELGPRRRRRGTARWR